MENIIFYDGSCGLCNKSVMFILEKDTKDVFLFCSQSSDYFKNTFEALDSSNLDDSVILCSNNVLFFKTQAVIKILQLLNYPKWIINILNSIPISFLNIFYDIVANYRKLLFKKSSCILLTSDLKKKFILD